MFHQNVGCPNFTDRCATCVTAVIWQYCTLYACTDNIGLLPRFSNAIFNLIIVSCIVLHRVFQGNGHITISFLISTEMSFVPWAAGRFPSTKSLVRRCFFFLYLAISFCSKAQHGNEKVELDFWQHTLSSRLLFRLHTTEELAYRPAL